MAGRKVGWYAHTAMDYYRIPIDGKLTRATRGPRGIQNGTRVRLEFEIKRKKIGTAMPIGLRFIKRSLGRADDDRIA